MSIWFNGENSISHWNNRDLSNAAIDDLTVNEIKVCSPTITQHQRLLKKNIEEN